MSKPEQCLREGCPYSAQAPDSSADDVESAASTERTASVGGLARALIGLLDETPPSLLTEEELTALDELGPYVFRSRRLR